MMTQLYLNIFSICFSLLAFVLAYTNLVARRKKRVKNTGNQNGKNTKSNKNFFTVYRLFRAFLSARMGFAVKR